MRQYQQSCSKAQKHSFIKILIEEMLTPYFIISWLTFYLEFKESLHKICEWD